MRRRGLRRRLFWIGVVLALLVLAGVGVAGRALGVGPWRARPA
jgi:hypothetical protein